MGRPKRIDLGGYVYHVLNRSNGQAPIFQENGDYEVFLRTISQALKHVPGMRLLSYCLMPNHWHLVLWPRKDGELSNFVHWLTVTHIHRWRAHHPNLRPGLALGKSGRSSGNCRGATVEQGAVGFAEPVVEACESPGNRGGIGIGSSQRKTRPTVWKRRLGEKNLR